MLRSLHIRHYVLIDSLDVEFPEGLIIITGQTGAGKSILLGALSLLTGARADASHIRSGEQTCVVEGEFFSGDPSLKDVLAEAGAEWDGGRILIRRVVYDSGRSRAFVNDCPVQQQVLSDLASSLVDIHSQHRSLLLSNRRFQLSLLDHFAGNTALAGRCADAWARKRRTEDELAAVRGRLESLKREGDYNRAQWEELDLARIRPGEMEELEQEQKLLSNAEEIKMNLARVLELTGTDDDTVCSAIREAERTLERTGRYLDAASGLKSRLESVRIELDDIRSEVERADASVALSRERLEEVDARISTIYGLLQKHGCRTEEELAALRDRYAESLEDTTVLSERLSELEKALVEADAGYGEASSALTASRRGAADAFASAVLGDMRSLELDKAVFEVEVAGAAPGPTGRDSVIFKFDSNGAAPQDVAKCASGGEVSRIMLCLKAMMARYEGMPTMIFDEIDSGVSGSVAHRMGDMICRMGSDMQVFAITHLPQVAAKGSAHYLVSKSDDGTGRSVSTVSKIGGEDRVRELARMLSGAQITPEALANARSLLGGN